MIIIHTEAITNNLYLSILSLSLPTNGIMINEAMPLTMNNKGSWCGVTCRLLMAKALPKGIIIKPPIDSKAVAVKPTR
jgi:hypothetical protein